MDFDMDIIFNALYKVVGFAKDIAVFGAKLGANATAKIAGLIPKKAAKMAKKGFGNMSKEDKIKIAVACATGIACFCAVLSLGKKK